MNYLTVALFKPQTNIINRYFFCLTPVYKTDYALKPTSQISSHDAIAPESKTPANRYFLFLGLTPELTAR